MKFLAFTAVIFLAIIDRLGCFTINWDDSSVDKKLYDQPNPNIGNKRALSPVIFVNGDGGCQIDAKLSKPSLNKIMSFCYRKSKWYTLWLSYEELVVAISCFVENFKLEYNSTTRKTVNPIGVTTRVPGFGTPDTIEYIDPHRPYKKYFSYIANALVYMGYVRNVSLRGAPYDFRKAPNELQDYYKNLKNLIEETYAKNNNLKVTFIIHSLGGPTIHYFLIHQDQKWKDKYIQTMISLSGAWAGSVRPLKIYTMGDNLGSYMINQNKMRRVLITFPSTSFLLPSRELWSDDEILIQSPEKNITTANLKDFFSALNFPNGYEMHKDTRDLLYKAPPPGVEVHCLHGVGVPTVDKLIYKNFTSDFPMKRSPKLHEGDGDGTVNRRSLEACLRWKGKQKHPVYHKSFSKVDHMGILDDRTALDYMIVQLHKFHLSNSLLLKKRSYSPTRRKSSPNSIHSIDDWYKLPSSSSS